MSVILQMGNKAASQGYDNPPGGAQEGCTLTNSGTETVYNVFLKVVDTSVFETLLISGGSVGTSTTCLNVYCTYPIHNFTDGNKTFSAGTTKDIYFYDFDVNDSAPIQVHNLVCYWQYLVT